MDSTLVKSPEKIMFIANNRNPGLFRNDPSYIYRCENLGLALADRGWDVGHQHWSQFGAADLPRVMVFHRPLASLRLWWLLRRLRRQGVILIADFDDLIIDEQYADYSPGVLNRLISNRITVRRFRRHRRALGWFDAITVSTSPLAEHVQRLCPGVPVEVAPNVVHRNWLPARVPVGERLENKVLSYFPGTRSHDRDFASISGVLSEFLLKHPEVHLKIVGPLEFSLESHAGQITHQEKVPFSEYQALLKGSWLNLAPLEDTPFNDCKSALKVLEAGFFCVPTLCSSNADMQRYSEAGALIAENDKEWLSGLEVMLDDEAYLEKTRTIRDMTLELANIDAQADGLLSLLGKIRHVNHA
jgi:hypothetical protein